jgi:membrane-bound lytic murein transglycosylase D
MGEGGLRRKIEKYKTTDYWTLIQKNALPEETQNYVPKILAAMLITKAPNLYGFRLLEKREPLKYDYVSVPGGTDLNTLAEILGVTKKSIKELNSELIIGYIPKQISAHTIRVPAGAGKIIAEFISQNKPSEWTN